MGSRFKGAEHTSGGGSSPVTTKASVFVVDDEELIREALEPLLEGAGYDVAFAEDGREALAQMRAGAAPDIILFDLAMPSMNGWEFRAIQKRDPLLSHVPVVAITADGSPQAEAISAEAYLRKPFGAQVLLDTIQRILADKNRQAAIPAERDDGVTALTRLASAVGHEINNPLTIVMLNMSQSIRELEPSILALKTPSKMPLTASEADNIAANLLGVVEILGDGKAGAERIRDTVAKLARLSHGDRNPRGFVDIHALLERSISCVWKQLGDRTRLIKCFGKVPAIRGDDVALEQVFVNLMLNAVDAIPADAPEWNEIRVVTRVAAGTNGPEAVVEVQDSGVGLSPEAAARLFEPFFTTKPVGSGDGTGLGLSTARQTVLDHGGRVTVEPQRTRGAIARVFLPIAAAEYATHSEAPSGDALAGRPGLEPGNGGLTKKD